MKNRITLPIQNNQTTASRPIKEITLISLGSTNPIGRATTLLAMAGSIAEAPKVADTVE